MRKRREKTTPINPTNFVQCVELLLGAETYNKHLRHTIEQEGEGALIFATPKGLALANSPEVKVSMTDATFQCCPRQQHTGLYQLLIFHVMRYNKPVPIFHIAMTNKKETLYTEIMEWIKQECPLLNPSDINMDFELAEMNSAKAVFDIDPTGCDFHYNQAILRKIGKKGLKKTLSKNAEFSKWVYQIMALNHLPADKIEATFRELCSRQIPLSASAKKAKESFQRYWEHFWLNTIGVDRLSVYRAPLRTNNHCESYHSKLSKQIGIRPNFWIFVRQLNRLLEINDINMSRLEQETPINRDNRRQSVNEGRIQALIRRLETGRPAPITAMEYVKAIAHLQTSKFKDNGDMDSDSDSEIENPETVDNDEVDAADEEADTAPSTNQRDITCQICMENACDAILLPCGHTSCNECGEILKREKKDCHICRGRIRRVQRMFLN